jgi:hypothetical protein
MAVYERRARVSVTSLTRSRPPPSLKIVARETGRRQEMVAAFQRAAAAHERAAKTHEIASRFHSDAARLFGQARPASADRERGLATSHARAAAAERRLAVSDWAVAQRCAAPGGNPVEKRLSVPSTTIDG